jgi:molecular chaperone IbpA
MNMIDFSPLFRTAIGFDRLASLAEEANRQDNGGYPPYNIERVDEDQYRITMAVAGFSQQELELESKANLLRVSARKTEDQQQRTYLHQGIATRSFERRFQLADHVRVQSASLQDGLLNIDLVREVPEAMKTRKIAIQAQVPQAAIERKAA